MNKLKSYAASKRGRDTLLCFGIVIIAYIIVQAAIAGGGISSQIKGLLVPICAYVVMAISLNLTVGILGELSLGHAGFMSVGAFAGIVTTTCLADAIPLSSGIVSQRAYEEHCALAFFGHTHRMMLERENGVWVCNPGSISLPRGGPASYARLTIENGRATLLELVDEDGSLLRKESL